MTGEWRCGREEEDGGCDNDEEAGAKCTSEGKEDSDDMDDDFKQSCIWTDAAFQQVRLDGG